MSVSRSGRATRETQGAAAWPAAPGEPLVFLAEASTPVEHQVLQSWIEDHRPRETAPGAAELVTFPHPHHDELLAVGELEACLARDDDPLLAPVRVAWLPPERNGERTSRLSDFMTLRDPRNPSTRQQHQIRARSPDRIRVLVGEPARKSQLRQRWERVSGRRADTVSDLARYVARQAVITLERTEAREVDERYKLPRLVKEEIVNSARFRSGIAKLAGDLGRDVADVDAEVQCYLDEMVSGRSRMLIDFVVRLGRFFYQQGYETIDCVPAEIERVRDAARRHGIVLLPTHRSNLDALVMPVALYENRLPRTHTLGGINMAFWPIGALTRRAGVIFIRRETRDNPVYRWTLREYIGYLVEKHFSLQWYPEGTRSRSGKLLRPKVGLLVYVVDAYREGRVDDVALVPASVAYDQLQEVTDFVDESVGGAKKPEGLGWAIDYWRKLRGRYGRVYVRFAEPLSLREALGPSRNVTEPDGSELQLQKLSLDVMRRINEVTPITGTALLTLVLLGSQGRALTMQLLRLALDDFLADATMRDLPMAASARALETDDGVVSVLHELVRTKVVSCYDEGPDAVYGIGPDQHLAAAFYRNSIIHFFVSGSIAELALVRASEVVAGGIDGFWNEALHLRDLLEFEFFFADSDKFRTMITGDLTMRDNQWQSRIAEGPDAIRGLVERLRPLTAYTVLRSFLESYLVVAEALEDLEPGDPLDERSFLASCLKLGRQFLLQRRIQRPEAISNQAFRNGLELARSRRLDVPAPDVMERRRAFSRELRGVIDRVDVVEGIATEQFVRRATSAHRGTRL
jgi:glycerol-3-phosphate O-acyltransferase